mmetsp:Transcript_58689/g.104372  ORF Transcript_58689/g.104372 Transcript_58689/m.104372 type:complete len:200 (+) Transcript_58689:416-1015(+)
MLVDCRRPRPSSQAWSSQSWRISEGSLTTPNLSSSLEMVERPLEKLRCSPATAKMRLASSARAFGGSRPRKTSKGSPLRLVIAVTIPSARCREASSTAFLLSRFRVLAVETLAKDVLISSSCRLRRPGGPGPSCDARPDAQLGRPKPGSWPLGLREMEKSASPAAQRPSSHGRAPSKPVATSSKSVRGQRRTIRKLGAS